MIRTAAPDDADQLGRLHVLAWQQAYEGLLPQPFLDSLDPQKRAEGWSRVLGKGDELATVFVDETEPGQFAGFACFGPSQDTTEGTPPAELSAMYYDQAYWGSGRPGELWDAVRRELDTRGFSAIGLWVLFENWRAIAFYRKQGFVFDGHEREERLQGTSIREVRMVRQPE